MNRKNIDSYFFHTWTEQSAYVLGYIFAHGTITQDPDSPNMKVSISGTDLETLEKIKEVMKSEHKISHYKDGDYILSFVDETILEKLMEFGVPRRETDEWGIPNVPKEYLSHFIRGYFDGKGHFSYQKHNHNKRRLRSSFTIRDRNFAEWFADLLASMGLRRANPLERPRKDGVSYELIYYVRDTKKLYNIMYRNASLFMRPKRAYFEENVSKKGP